MVSYARRVSAEDDIHIREAIPLSAVGSGSLLCKVDLDIDAPALAQRHDELCKQLLKSNGMRIEVASRIDGTKSPVREPQPRIDTD